VTIRVVIADDQPVVRDGLAMLLGLLDDVEIVATASDGVQAVERACAERPDIVLMDLRMPRLEGAEATRQILASLPETRVLVLTTYADDESLFPALQAGARGYLTKDATAEEIEQAIRKVDAGQTHLDPAVQQRLVAAVLDQAHPPPGEPATVPRSNVPDELTQRELEVLKLIAAGLSNREIADALVLSNGLCLDVRSSGTANGTPVQIWGCNGTGAQQWTYVEAGSTLHALGKCLDIPGGATADGTKLQIWDCNNTAAQVFIHQSDNSYYNPQSNKCLDDPGFSGTAGTQVQIWDCNGTGAQHWVLQS